MITLTVINNKGGVGKSFLSTQFAFYCALKRGLRTLFIDLDPQAHSSNCLFDSKLFEPANVSSGLLMQQGGLRTTGAARLLVRADTNLEELERSGEEAHNGFVENLLNSLNEVKDDFDICIIDTNPSYDIRQIAALLAATHYVCPVNLKQEALEGVEMLLGRAQEVSTINEKLQFAGLVLNMVERKPYQIENFKQLWVLAKDLILKQENGLKPAWILNRNEYAAAQGQHRPVWVSKNSKPGEAWYELRTVFLNLAAALNLPENNPLRVVWNEDGSLGVVNSSREDN